MFRVDIVSKGQETVAFSSSQAITKEASIVPLGTLQCALIMTDRPNKWKPGRLALLMVEGREGTALRKVCPPKKC